MLYEITGNLLDIEEGILAHQVNCKGVMGSGIAKQVKDKWPDVYTRYAEYCNQLEYRSDLLLGCTKLAEVNDKLWIANVFGQNNYGVDKRQTSYDATYDAWAHLFEQAEWLGYPIYMPYQMGCGLGGGSWEIYTAIIDSFKATVPVTVVKLPE